MALDSGTDFKCILLPLHQNPLRAGVDLRPEGQNELPLEFSVGCEIALAFVVLPASILQGDKEVGYVVANVHPVHVQGELYLALDVGDLPGPFSPFKLFGVLCFEFGVVGNTSRRGALGVELISDVRHQ